nr:DUF389 domain-containing protein [Asgard group archaeon]
GLIYNFSLNEPSAFTIARGEPNLVDLIIAIASGLTVGICFVSGTSLALVGVAVAAALLPVTVNIGIAMGLFEWRIALGSLVLFVTNVVCVVLGTMTIFWIRKVEPPQAVKKVKAKRSLKTQIIAFGLVFLAVAFPIIQTSVQIGRQWRYQKITNDVANDMLKPLDGVIFPPEELTIKVSGGIFGGYTVNITMRLFSTKTLPNTTYSNFKNEIELRANHAIQYLKLEVILIQDFGSIATVNQNQFIVSMPLLFNQVNCRRIILG